MSGSLFCLVLDPFLRVVLSRFPYCGLWPATTFTAYLDDIAAVLAQTFAQLPLLLHLFDHFEAGAGPKLNTRKNVLIPLRTTCLVEAAAKVRRLIPRAAEFIIKFAHKFLGVILGPEGNITAWDAPFFKYCNRLHRIRNFGLGLNNTLALHNTHGFSVLSHTMQFHTHTQRLHGQDGARGTPKVSSRTTIHLHHSATQPRTSMPHAIQPPCAFLQRKGGTVPLCSLHLAPLRRLSPTPPRHAPLPGG